jgi:hypothetical protein
MYRCSWSYCTGDGTRSWNIGADQHTPRLRKWIASWFRRGRGETRFIVHHSNKLFQMCPLARPHYNVAFMSASPISMISYRRCVEIYKSSRQWFWLRQTSFYKNIGILLFPILNNANNLIRGTVAKCSHNERIQIVTCFSIDHIYIGMNLIAGKQVLSLTP